MNSPPREEALRRRLRDLREGLRRPGGRQTSELIELADILDSVLATVQTERRAGEEREARLVLSQTRMEGRLERVEESIIFRVLRKAGVFLSDQRRKAGQRLLHSRLHPLYRRLAQGRMAPDPYAAWLERHEAKEPSIAHRRDEIATWQEQPLISVLMPLFDPRVDWLQAAIDSVLGQSYRAWQLCLAVDGQASPWLHTYLRSLAAAEPRIRWCETPERGGISRTLNAAGRLADGEYLGILDQDDLLSRDALFSVADAAVSESADAFYSDEEWFGGSQQRRPNFKPGWSPDLLTSSMYWGHFFVVSRTAIDRAGWFRSEFDGAQDYDLALRLTDGPARVTHIPRTLYHWRQHADSTANSPAAKPYAHEAGLRALEEAVRRRGWNASVVEGPERHSYVLQRSTSPEPLVSLIICTRKPRLLQRCLRELEASTAYRNTQVVVVHHQPFGRPDSAIDTLIKRYGCKGVPYIGAFHFSRMNNLAVEAADGSVLVFLNDDVVPLRTDWLDRLTAQASRSEVGVAGGKLLYPSGTIQHSGIVVQPNEGTFHAGRGLIRSDLWRWLDMTRNVSAVTGACLAIRRDLFEQLGGFDPLFPINFNDVDLCLRARAAGFEVVLETQALLRHDECQTRLPGVGHEERQRFLERWSGRLSGADPFYSAQLDPSREQTALAQTISA